MPRPFTRAEAKPLDWREEKTLVKTQARIAEVDRLLAEARERVRTQHANLLLGTKQAVERSELEVLAGRGSEADLAVKQQAHLDARMADARDRIQIEDLEAEAAKLATKLVEVRVAAKKASIKSVKAKYRALLKRISASLTDAVQADAELGALQQDADQMFRAFDGNAFSSMDEDHFPVRAGIRLLSRTSFDQYRGYKSITISSTNASTLDTIEETLKGLDEEEAAEAAAAAAAQRPESSGLV